MQKILFPYETVRPEQKKIIDDVSIALTESKNLLIHSPTGSGKTISVLGPALVHALSKDLTVFFLTSRQTQHLLALRTVRDIENKFNQKIRCCDLIAKQQLCAQPVAPNVPGTQFGEYCKALRDDDLCEFYVNFKDKIRRERCITELAGIADTGQVNESAKVHKVCPYEIASTLARDAHLIIADYNYLFHPGIRKSFLGRCNKHIEDSIIIIDEGHNLPGRCRDMLSSLLSSSMIQRGIKEANKYDLGERIRLISLLCPRLNTFYC